MEKIPSRLELIFPQIIDQFVNELEERFTSPGSIEDITSEDMDILRKGEKIELTPGKKGLLAKLGQDYRLSPEEMDILLSKVFI